jgi:uncharacterized protein (TIGR03000 family)
MFRTTLSFTGSLLLAGAAILTMPGSGQAQRGGGHGGGHFGGYHGGGYGGAHYGGYHGGAHYGGYHGGAHYGGYHYGYPYGHYGYHHGHYGYGAYYPYYGYYGNYYPYYGYYNNYPYSYNTYPYAYDSGYYGSYGDVAPSYSNDYSSVTPPVVSDQSFDAAAARPNTSAHVTAIVPAVAHLWFNGTATTSTGSVREFTTPPLERGNRYTYEVKATWNENGQEVTQTQQVQVTPGAYVVVSFPAPPKTTAQASTAKKG